MKREACHGPTDHLRRHRGRIEEARDQARGVPRAQDAAVPWAELVAAVEPFYYPGKRGRRPIGVERMLRMYFLQLWFGLSDEGVEDAIYGSRAFSRFMGVGFGLGDQVPDATTLLKFRRMIEELNSRHVRFRSAVKNPREASLAAKREEAEGSAAETLFVLQRT